MGLKTEEFTDRHLRSVPKVITVLKYLNQGRELKLGDYKIKMAQTVGDGFSFVTPVTVTSTEWEGTRTEWLGFEMNMQHFSEAVNKLTDEEITIMQAEMALQNINKKNR